MTSFRPAWWLPGAHAQTIGGRFLRRRLRVDFQRERMEIPDGDFVDLDFAVSPGMPADAPLVLILHGLEGCSRSGYVLAMLAGLADAGMRGVVLKFRSCSGELNRLPRFYHAGDTEDLAVVLDQLRLRFPGVATAAIGFSLGGNVLLKFLGERGDAARHSLSAAVAVSVPFDLAAGADKLEKGMGRVYTAWFMRNLLRKSRIKAEQLQGRCDMERLVQARTLRQFDDLATAPLHGFRDASDYYQQSSSVNYLADVRVPTLILHSSDDPFLPAASVPRMHLRQNPFLAEEITSHGGHVGFVGGTPWAPVFWAESEAVRFLAAHLAASR